MTRTLNPLYTGNQTNSTNSSRGAAFNKGNATTVGTPAFPAPSGIQARLPIAPATGAAVGGVPTLGGAGVVGSTVSPAATGTPVGVSPNATVGVSANATAGVENTTVVSDLTEL